MKKIVSLILMMIFIQVIHSQTPWDGHTITPVTPVNDVYVINTASELAWIAQSCNNGNSFSGSIIILMANLDLGGTQTPKAEWTPIGSSSSLFFAGMFDGNGNKISNLYIRSQNDNVGLFGYVNNGTISNLIINNIDIKGNNCVGGFVGYNIVNKQASETGNYYSNCYLTGTVEGNEHVGGFVGFNANTTMDETGNLYSNCCVNATVKGVLNIGGFVGSNILNTQASETGNLYSGCFATTNVEGSSSVGGFVGFNHIEYQATYTGNYFLNSYSSGTIKGNNQIGGFVGYNSSSEQASSTGEYNRFLNCYTTSGVKGLTDVGNFCGKTDILNFNSCYFDKQICGQEKSIGSESTSYIITGLFTSMFTNGNNFGLDNNENDWSFISGEYPQLSYFLNHTDSFIQNLSYLSVSPLFLKEDNSSYEKSTAVINNFTVSTSNNVVWNSENSTIISIVGNQATINNHLKDSDIVLIANLNNCRKYIRLTLGEYDNISNYKNNSLDVSIFPNPCNDYLYIENKDNFKNIKEIQLFDISGKKIANYFLNNSSITISLKNISSGIYFISIFDENGSKQNYKIIKE